MNKFKKWMALAVSTAILAGGVTLAVSAIPVYAASCGSGGTTWIQTHLGSGQSSLTDSNNWGGGDACLTVPGTDQAHAGAFTVLSQSMPDVNEVLAAPETRIGCSGGYCTPSSGLPKSVGEGIHPSITWDYNLSGVVTGTKSDEEINATFSTDCSGNSSPVASAFIGIYLNAAPSYANRGLPSSGTQVTIDSTEWYTQKAFSNGHWKLEFSRVTPSATGVTNLAVGGFISWIGSHWGATVLPNTSCMTELDTDNEIWSGGAGFQSTGTSMTTP